MSQISSQKPSDVFLREFLEKLTWGTTPRCPYCNSVNATKMRHEPRFHCNNCNTSFSVTVGTVFQKNRVGLAKWFEAVVLVITKNDQLRVKQLAKRIGVNKNTACRMILHIQIAMHDQRQRKMLLSIVDNFEDIFGDQNEI